MHPIIHTSPSAVTRAQARMLIDLYLRTGSSSHSRLGATLWVLLAWLQRQNMPYRLLAYPGQGYSVERIEGEPNAERNPTGK